MGAALRQGGHTARAMLEKGWQAMNRVPGLQGVEGMAGTRVQGAPPQSNDYGGGGS